LVYKKAKKKSHIDAKSVFRRKAFAIKEETKKYQNHINEIKNDIKASRGKVKPNQMLQKRMLLLKAKKSKRFAISNMRKKPIHSFI